MKKAILLKTTIVILFFTAFFAANAQSSRRAEINIIDFNVVMSQNKVNIQWSTDKETPANYFEVEKSYDGKNFKTVALVLGADPAKTDCDCYGYFDKTSKSIKKFYYRLKHIDSEGVVEFSDVRMLALK